MSSSNIQVRPARKHRFHFLDALRGIAAIILVPGHIMQEFALNLPMHNVYLVVDFFFCLSGFVIAFSYESRLAQRLDFRGFVATRLIRLYPLAVFGSLVGLVHMAVRAPAWHMLPGSSQVILVVAAIFLLPNYLAAVIPFGPFATSLYPFDIPLWSLYFEMLANMFYALLIRCRVAKSWVLALVAGISFVYLASFLRTHDGINYGLTVGTASVGLARVGFSFFVGTLLFRLYVRLPSTGIRGLTGSAAALLLTGVLIFVLALSPWFARSPYFDLLAVALLFPAIVFTGAFIRLPEALTSPCAFLGDLSYPLYILHISVLGALLHGPSLVLAAQHAWYRQYFAPVYLAIMACAAWALQRYVDTPLRRFLSARYNRLRAAGQHPSLETPAPNKSPTC